MLKASTQLVFTAELPSPSETRQRASEPTSLLQIIAQFFRGFCSGKERQNTDPLVDARQNDTHGICSLVWLQNYRYLDLLNVLCVCDGVAIPDNQTYITEQWLMKDQVSLFKGPAIANAVRYLGSFLGLRSV